MKGMKELLKELYMLNRLAVSDDTEKALNIIKQELPEMKICEVPSGTECWTWIVPDKWVIHDAYISDGNKKIVDINDHILHVVSCSVPVDKWVSREELMKHLYTAESYRADMGYQVPERPNAIPWVVKYYERDWGFCLQKNRLRELKGDKFYVKIDSEFVAGSLKIGELTIPGQTDEMVVIITNICHPAQVNDSISGLVVAVDIAKQMARKQNHYTYQFLFLPETIGSIAYLSQNEQLIPKMKYGLFTEMLGNKNSLILQKSRQGNSRVDRIAGYVLKRRQKEFRAGNFREVLCNDEIILNGPGVNVPTISLSRWPYPEYHTSDDCPDIVLEGRLEEARDTIMEILRILDSDFIPVRQFKGPVCLSRYGLWVEWRESAEKKSLNENIEKVMLELEGELSAFDIADKLGMDFDTVVQFLNGLHQNGLISKSKEFEDER